MDMARYCYDKKMTYEQYQTFKDNIQKAAEAAISYIKSMYKTDTGVYHRISEIFPASEKTDTYDFIIYEMKQQGVEFYDNNKYWRL